MKLCMISSEYPPKWGGVGVVTYYLATWMAKLGHEVHVVTRKQVIGYEPSHQNIQIHPVRWLKAPLLFTTSFGKNAVRWYRDSGIDFDLVHVHSNMALIPERYYDIFRCPVVTTMHGTWWGERSTISLKDLTPSISTVNDLAILYLGPLMDRYEDLALKRSNAVVIESLTECRDIKRRGVKNRYGRWIRLPPGIDMNEFHPSKNDEQLREKALGGSDGKLIVSVGRWAARKGIREVLGVFEKIRESRKDVVLALVGWGPLEGEIERRIKKSGLGGSIRTYRSMPSGEMQSLVASADLALFHSYWEGFGLTVGEALSSGTPVSATAVGGAPELVPLSCGRLVDVGDVEGQARDVLALLERDDLREMGLKGREHIKSFCSWDLVAKRTQSLYEWVLQDPENEGTWRDGFDHC